MFGGDRFEKETAVFEGVELLHKLPRIKVKTDPYFYLDGRDKIGRKAEIGFDEEMLSKHLLFMGGIGTGKTTAMYHIVSQLRETMTENDVMLIFDSKGDFYKKFHRPHDVVISNDRSASDGISANYWNLFSELDDEEHLDEDLNEISHALFYEKVKSSRQPFFPLSAKDLFKAVLYYFKKSGGVDPNNDELRRFFDFYSATTIKEYLSAYPELGGALSSIDGESDQTQGTFTELQQVVQEILAGNFRKDGTLSIRKLIRNKGARVIFIEYDLAYGNMLAPIYRLLFDLALKEALSRQEFEAGEPGHANVFLIADEFRLLPFLQHIDNAVNFGRSLGIKMVIGIQNVEQIYDGYGAERARSILSGFSTKICFRLNDGVSRHYFQDVLGKNRKIESYLSTRQHVGLSEKVYQANVVEDWDITTLDRGEAIVSLPEHPPFFFKFDPYSY